MSHWAECQSGSRQFGWEPKASGNYPLKRNQSKLEPDLGGIKRLTGTLPTEEYATRLPTSVEQSEVGRRERQGICHQRRDTGSIHGEQHEEEAGGGDAHQQLDDRHSLAQPVT